MPKVATMPKVVIVGGGVSAHLMLKALHANSGLKAAGVEITMVSAQPYKEGPWAGPIALAAPEEHFRFVDETATAGVTVLFGSAVAINGGSLTVSRFGSDGATEQVPYDSLVAATGFKMPGIINDPGQPLAERREFFENVKKQFSSGGNVVVAGAGIVAVELVANIAEEMAIKKSGPKGSITLLVGSGILPTYPLRVQNKVGTLRVIIRDVYRAWG
jgi:NADH dehydrogenase FAD-containing subunit